jgi:hypothetical protein
MTRTRHEKEYRKLATWDALRKLQRAIHHLHEAMCSGEITPRQDKRYDRLVGEAKQEAAYLGGKAYIQGDPRGCALYVYWPADLPQGASIDTCYSSIGIACI